MAAEAVPCRRGNRTASAAGSSLFRSRQPRRSTSTLADIPPIQISSLSLDLDWYAHSRLLPRLGRSSRSTLLIATGRTRRSTYDDADLSRSVFPQNGTWIDQQGRVCDPAYLPKVNIIVAAVLLGTSLLSRDSWPLTTAPALSSPQLALPTSSGCLSYSRPRHRHLDPLRGPVHPQT